MDEALSASVSFDVGTTPSKNGKCRRHLRPHSRVGSGCETTSGTCVKEVAATGIRRRWRPGTHTAQRSRGVILETCEKSILSYNDTEDLQAGQCGCLAGPEISGWKCRFVMTAIHLHNAHVDIQLY